MKTDTYTKTMLTLIALMLSINVFQNLFSVQNATANGVYDCDQCDLLDDIDKRTKDIESDLYEIKRKASDIESKTFGNYCGNCP
jgi:peptidoglycan hydrolase CwlO-like protein